jgi:hypothetical protein
LYGKTPLRAQIELGLIEKRMTTFVAAADETEAGNQLGLFMYGGFVAPVHFWEDWFVPAWEERVLNTRPNIPYMHISEVRTSRWQRQQGISKSRVEAGINEAARVIASSGALHHVRNEMDGGHFRSVFRETRVIRRSKQPGLYQFQPDYIGFLGFAYGALDFVWREYPGAERVDFVIERKSGITQHVTEFHASLGESLAQKGETHLVPLIGELIPGGKETVSLQAADFVMWHQRRFMCGECDASDIRRLTWMLGGRPMTQNSVSPSEITGIGARSKARNVRSPFQAKRRIARPNDDDAAF